MKKFKVQFISYDMSKTKKRKRKDMLVDAKNERSVRLQLEKIHKGEKVEAIHEIIWDEEQIAKVLEEDEADSSEYYIGSVKFFNVEKGFGFIRPDEDIENVFFHQTACTGELPKEHDTVEFKIVEGPKGLMANHVRVLPE